MKNLQKNLRLMFLCACVLFFIQSQSKAVWELTLTNGDYIIPYPEWDNPHTLNTFNDVSVIMNQGGGASILNMYDNSNLATHLGSGVGELNLYDNAAVSLYEDIISLYVAPDSTALVKLYAVEIWHDAYDPEHQQIGFYWLDNPLDFDTINLIGSSTYSHIQFIPEPATIALLAVGFFAIRKSRKR